MKITYHEYEKPSFSLRPSKKFPQIPPASEFLGTKQINNIELGRRGG